MLILFSPSQSQSPTLSILHTLSLHSLFTYSPFHTLLCFYVVTLLLSFSLTPLTLHLSLSHTPILIFCHSYSLLLSLSTLSLPLLPFSHTPLHLRWHYNFLLLSHSSKSRHTMSISNSYTLSLCTLCSLTPFFMHSFTFTLSLFFSPTLSHPLFSTLFHTLLCS